MVTIRCKNQIFTEIQAIIFDKDGTLEDSQDYLRALAIKRARAVDAKVPGVGEALLMAFGIQEDILDPAGLMAVGSRRENEIAAAAYIAETGRSWYEAIALAQAAFQEADRRLVADSDGPFAAPLFEKTVEVLADLASGGLKLGILSAATHENVRAFIKRHGLADFIQVAFGSNGPLSKPDPLFLIAACQQLGVPPEATLVVGDSQNDIAMAKQAGAAGAIAIARVSKNLTPFSEADAIITELSDLQIS